MYCIRQDLTGDTLRGVQGDREFNAQAVTRFDDGTRTKAQEIGVASRGVAVEKRIPGDAAHRHSSTGRFVQRHGRATDNTGGGIVQIAKNPFEVVDGRQIDDVHGSGIGDVDRERLVECSIRTDRRLRAGGLGQIERGGLEDDEDLAIAAVPVGVVGWSGEVCTDEIDLGYRADGAEIRQRDHARTDILTVVIVPVRVQIGTANTTIGRAEDLYRAPVGPDVEIVVPAALGDDDEAAEVHIDRCRIGKSLHQCVRARRVAPARPGVQVGVLVEIA